jgi:hypothetical protein
MPRFLPCALYDLGVSASKNAVSRCRAAFTKTRNLLLPAVIATVGCAPALNRPVMPVVPNPGLPQIQQGEPAPAPITMQYVPPIGSGMPAVMLANPLRVPVVDRDFAWDQLIAVVEEYFKVEREERVRLAGDILTEGRIDTYPLTGASLLEPWHGDSVTFRDRLESTLQSIRRRCFVRVIPEQASYLIDLQVFKELEDLPRPSMSTAGAATFNSGAADEAGTLPVPAFNQAAAVRSGPRPINWILQGRDLNLEQVMLAKVQARLSVAVAPAVGLPAFGPPVVAPPSAAPPAFGAPAPELIPRP